MDTVCLHIAVVSSTCGWWLNFVELLFPPPLSALSGDGAEPLTGHSAHNTTPPEAAQQNLSEGTTQHTMLDSFR